MNLLIFGLFALVYFVAFFKKAPLEIGVFKRFLSGVGLAYESYIDSKPVVSYPT